MPPAGNTYYIQTNGPAAAIGLGDYYTSTSGGNQTHLLRVFIPCSWPAGTAVHVDLFGAEVTSFGPVQGRSEELAGPADSSRFQLSGPGGPAAARTYQPTTVAETWTRLHTIADGRAGCGEWLLTSQLLTTDPANPGTGGNDQNGWKLRVGADNDLDPTNASPPNSDNPDGIPGTDDEIVIGLERTTFQHDAGAVVCQTFYSYVAPGTPTARFHNFDMDNNGRVRYYPPGSVVDPTANSGGVLGTRSANARWNGSANTTRVGDAIANPAPGWWTVVSCISNHNQLIQEGVNSGQLFMSQPGIPVLTVAKDNAATTLVAGGTSTYAITVTNTSNATATPGAARAVSISDPLPAPLQFVSCAVRPPDTGTCSENAGVISATLDGALVAGAAAVVDVEVAIPAAAVSQSVTNTATVGFTDSYGNPFPPVTGADTDTIVRPADVYVSASWETPVYSGQDGVLQVEVGNEGVEPAADVVVGGPLPSGFAISSFDAPGWSCASTATDWSCTRSGDLVVGPESLRLLGTVTAAAGVPITADVAVSTTTLELDLADNTATAVATPDAFPADVRVTAALGSTPEAGEPLTVILTVGSEGLDDADDVVVTGPIPPGFTLTGFTTPAGWSCTGGATFTCTRTGTFSTGAPDEEIRLLGEVTGAGGSSLGFDATVSTSTLELDLADNNDTAAAVIRSLGLAATAVCEQDVPWLDLTATPVGFDPGPNATATVTWRKLDGSVVRTDTNVALNDRLLWPGAALDTAGNPTDWPGWDFVSGQWVQVADGLDGTLAITVAVNPQTDTLVTYPQATAACAAQPPAVSAAAETGTTAPAGPAAPAGVDSTGLASTGAALLPLLVLAFGLLIVGAGLRRTGRQSPGFGSAK